MLGNAEVIALLLDVDASDSRATGSATMLVRDANGQMSLQPVNPDSTLGRYAMSTNCFRKSKPIFDPVSRELLGYEMEMIPTPLAALGQARRSR